MESTVCSLVPLENASSIGVLSEYPCHGKWVPCLSSKYRRKQRNRFHRSVYNLYTYLPTYLLNVCKIVGVYQVHAGPKQSDAVKVEETEGRKRRRKSKKGEKWKKQRTKTLRYATTRHATHSSHSSINIQLVNQALLLSR